MDRPTDRPMRCARALRDLARGIGRCLALSLLVGFAAAQVRPVDALLVGDAERLLSHADPRVRGEAALAVAAGGDKRVLQGILRVAADEEPTARAMGLLALGYLGAAGSESFLVAALPKPGAKKDLPALAAAFALARMPADSGSTALNQRLVGTTEASFQRERDALLALLAGLLDRGGNDAESSLERLAQDTSLRDPHARAATLCALATSPRVLGNGILEPALRSTSAEVRCAAIKALSHHPDALASRLDRIVEAARADVDPRVRAAALACLTEFRHLPALELAERAMRSKDPDEASQGVETALRLGGEPTRRALSRHFSDLGEMAQRRLLENVSSPAPEDLLAACHDAATDRRRHAATRHAALLALLRTGQTVSPENVLHAFTEADWAIQSAIASALHGQDLTHDLLAATSTYEGSSGTGRRASMLAALMSVDTTGASLRCARGLAVDADTQSALVATRALRILRLPALRADAQRYLPEPLRALFEP